MDKSEIKLEENVNDFIIEDDALRNLKLRESVFNPNRSWKNYTKAVIQMLLGFIFIGCHIYMIIFGSDSLSMIAPLQILFGIYMILNGVLMWHKKDIDLIHQRIDALIELQVTK